MKKLFVIALALMMIMSVAMAEVAPAFTLQPAAAEASVEPTATPEPEPFYFLPESNIRLITEEELANVDLETLGYMRNEILARYGYPFQKPHYQEYFRAQMWYVENPDFDYAMLNEIEMANVETIKKLEAKAQKAQ